MTDPENTTGEVDQRVLAAVSGRAFRRGGATFRLSQITGPGFWRSQAFESWGEGIHLLGQWGFFDQPEPRMDPFRWIAPVFRLFKPMRIFHFQLGEAEDRLYTTAASQEA